MNPVARWLPLACLMACSGKADTGTEGTAGAGTAQGEPQAPLRNGPGGSLVMSASCAPDDGRAWQLIIGLGSACELGAPDPTKPFVRMSVYHPELLDQPVGTEAAWSDGEHGQGAFYPSGSGGQAGTAPDGSLYLSQWDGADSGTPEEGGTAAGWYTLTLEDGTELGAAFEGVWCGGDPMCG